jgi:CDP-diacylglycerol pyrophosphatase
MAEQAVGVMLPCVRLNKVGADQEAFVALHIPTSKTNTLVVPTTRIEGIESSALQTSSGAALWRAALSARRLVADAARVELHDIGLAVNSQGSRT